MGDLALSWNGLPAYVDDAGRIRVGVKPTPPEIVLLTRAKVALVERPPLCESCHGAGVDDAVDYHRPCPHCGGSGLARREIS